MFSFWKMCIIYIHNRKTIFSIKFTVFTVYFFIAPNISAAVNLNDNRIGFSGICRRINIQHMIFILIIHI